MLPFLQAIAGLAVVLAVIGASAWLLRRFVQSGPARGSLVQLRGGLAVGPRERVVVVEVEGIWLVLGVAPGRVSALHTLPKGDVPAPAPVSDAKSMPSGFAAVLERMKSSRGS